MGDTNPAFHAVKLSDFLAEMPPEIQKAKSLEKFKEANAYYYEGRRTLRSGLVWIDNEDILCISVHGAEDYYWIEKSSRLNASQMWEWVQHLHGKSWMTPEILWDFVYLCGRPK